MPPALPLLVVLAGGPALASDVLCDAKSIVVACPDPPPAIDARIAYVRAGGHGYAPGLHGARLGLAFTSGVRRPGVDVALTGYEHGHTGEERRNLLQLVRRLARTQGAAIARTVTSPRVDLSTTLRWAPFHGKAAFRSRSIWTFDLHSLAGAGLRYADTYQVAASERSATLSKVRPLVVPTAELGVGTTWKVGHHLTFHADFRATGWLDRDGPLAAASAWRPQVQPAGSVGLGWRIPVPARSAQHQ